MKTARQSLYVHVFIPLMAALALGWAAPVAADEFPATGQTTVYRTGDDGDIQAGATLRYRDNRNGTITDRNTGLVWEKKDNNPNVGGIHNKDNTYTWDEAFGVHVATLNNTCANDEAVDCSVGGNADCRAAGARGRCGFAGNRDWRVPNVKELQSIVNYQFADPAVSDAFKTPCEVGSTVLTGSCTVAFLYWSSTTIVSFPDGAWVVNFSLGSQSSAVKNNNFLRVRAVRGGL